MTHDWYIIALTAVLAVANIAYVIVTAYMLSAIRNQGSALVNAERAWLMVEMGWAPLYGGITVGEGVEMTVRSSTSIASIRLACTNSGKTPAWIDQVQSALAIVRRGSEPPQITEDAENTKGPIPIAPGRIEQLDISLTTSGEAGVNEANLIYGIVRYRDAFSRKRATTFAYEATGTRLSRLSGYAEWNENT